MPAREPEDPLEVRLDLLSASIPSPLLLGGKARHQQQITFGTVSPSLAKLKKSYRSYVTQYGRSSRIVYDSASDSFGRASHWDTVVNLEEEELPEEVLLEKQRGGLDPPAAKKGQEAWAASPAAKHGPAEAACLGKASDAEEAGCDEPPACEALPGPLEGAAVGAPPSPVAAPAAEAIEPVASDAPLLARLQELRDPRLQVFRSPSAFLGVRGAQLLADTVAHAASGSTPELRVLELRCNYIGSAGARSLASAVHSLPNLQYLGLSCNSVADAGFSDLIDAICRGRCRETIEALDVSHNWLTEAAMERLSVGFAVCPLLREIDIRGNYCGQDATRRLKAKAGPDVRFGAVDIETFAVATEGLQEKRRLALASGDTVSGLASRVMQGVAMSEAAAAGAGGENSPEPQRGALAAWTEPKAGADASALDAPSALGGGQAGRAAGAAAGAATEAIRHRRGSKSRPPGATKGAAADRGTSAAAVDARPSSSQARGARSAGKAAPIGEKAKAKTQTAENTAQMPVLPPPRPASAAAARKKVARKTSAKR